MFGARIKTLRMTKTLSQQELAEQLNVSKQSISNWENDNILPSIDTLIRISSYFKVSTDYLLGLNESIENVKTVDVTGLSDEKILHIQLIVNDLKD